MPPPVIPDDSYTEYEQPLSHAPLTNPWTPAGVFVPDEQLLADLLTIPVTKGYKVESGRFPKAIDVWVARELRRGGFDPDAVWPRLTRPRVLPRSLNRVVTRLPAQVQAAVRLRLPLKTSGLYTEARVLGEFKSKQVDVLMAEW